MENTPFAAQQLQVNKFLEQTAKIGAMLDQQQGTTRTIFDTTGLVNGISSFQFFENVGAKVYPATNLEQNRFAPGEGMVIKEIGFFALNGNTPQFGSFSPFLLSTLDFYIGNNRVLKAVPLFAGWYVSSINNLAGLADTTQLSMRLRTNIVIPPQVQFKAELRINGTFGAVAPNQANLGMYVKGYGKLFNPRNNY